MLTRGTDSLNREESIKAYVICYYYYSGVPNSDWSNNCIGFNFKVNSLFQSMFILNLRSLLTYLVKVLGEDWCIIIHILHKHGQICITLLLGV